jgi:amino acid transporter
MYMDASKGPKQEQIADTDVELESGTGEVDHVGHTVRGLKPRHTQMIALGGSIGTGIFLGAGQNLARGGPAFLLLAYILLSLLVFLVVTAVTEVASYMPVRGSTMVFHGYRQVSSSLGFAMGYMYWYSLGILCPYEVVASALVIDYWGSPMPLAAWISIFIALILFLNLMPVSWYGESEFWFASMKGMYLTHLFKISYMMSTCQLPLSQSS